MAKTTPATIALANAGIAFEVVTYDYDPNAERIGLQAAEAIGAPPHRVLKTLMATVDGKPVCVVVPSDREVSMKKLAAAFGGKSAAMMKPADAERLTGYKVGGISPFGQRKAAPTAIEERALAEERVFINGGQRGLQVSLKPCRRPRPLEGEGGGPDRLAKRGTENGSFPFSELRAILALSLEDLAIAPAGPERLGLNGLAWTAWPPGGEGGYHRASRWSEPRFPIFRHGRA